MIDRDRRRLVFGDGDGDGDDDMRGMLFDDGGGGDDDDDDDDDRKPAAENTTHGTNAKRDFDRDGNSDGDAPLEDDGDTEEDDIFAADADAALANVKQSIKDIVLGNGTASNARNTAHAMYEEDRNRN